MGAVFMGFPNSYLNTSGRIFIKSLAGFFQYNILEVHNNSEGETDEARKRVAKRKMREHDSKYCYKRKDNY